MDVSFQIEGLDKLETASAQVRQAVADEINKAVYASAQKIRTEAIKSMQATNGRSGGRFYKHGNVLRQSSGPGEPPMSQTGRLVNSITAYAGGDGEAFTVAGRGTVKYAAFLEFGTSKMAARPFMFPALEKSRAWIAARLQDALRRGIERAGS